MIELFAVAQQLQQFFVGDWADIESVLIRQQRQLDWTYIDRTLAPLVDAKESPHILTTLAAVRARAETGS